MTYNVLMGTLNPAHSLELWITAVHWWVYWRVSTLVYWRVSTPVYWQSVHQYIGAGTASLCAFIIYHKYFCDIIKV